VEEQGREASVVKKKTHTKVGTALARLSAQATKPAGRQAARAGELLAIIARRMQRIEEDFFDIGIALKELKDKKLFVALGHPTFDAMLAKRVPIGRSQAYKLLAIAERVTRDEAIELGEEKAYAIARLVAITPEADTVASVLDKGVRVGKKRRSTKTMSRREIDKVKRTVAGRSKKPDPEERDAKREARAVQARLRARRVAANIDVAKERGKWFALVRVPIADLASLAGER
jgi:hypothetical protein